MSAKEVLCNEDLNFAVKVYSDLIQTVLVEVSRQSGISLRLGEVQTLGPEGRHVF